VTAAATLPALFARQAATRPTMPAMREKKRGIWQTESWADAFAAMKGQAFGLAALGFGPGDRLCVIGDNRPRLYWVQVAAQSLGGIAVPLDPNQSAEELLAQVTRADARWLVLETPELLHRLTTATIRMPPLRGVLVDNGGESGERDGVRIHDRGDVDALGCELAGREPDLVDRAIDRLSGDQIALLSFTSPPTAPGGSALVSHQALIAAAEAFANAEKVGPTDEWLAYLPIGWIADSLFSLALALVRGFPCSCPESPETTLVDLVDLRPHGFFAPRQTWEALRKSVEGRAGSSSPLKRRVFRYFLAAGLAAERARESGQPPAVAAKARLALGELLIFRPVRVKLGFGRCRWAYVDADVLDDDTERFFRAIGIDVKSLAGRVELGGFAGLCGSPSLTHSRVAESDRPDHKTVPTEE
jgi:long-chain acyl-CoA synthetase